jgi:hypothetical protein
MNMVCCAVLCIYSTSCARNSPSCKAIFAAGSKKAARCSGDLLAGQTNKQISTLTCSQSLNLCLVSSHVSSSSPLLQHAVSAIQALLPDAWPDMLRTLAGFLCPFRAMMQRQQQEAMAAAATAAAAAAGAAAGSSTEAVAPLRTPRGGAAAPSTPHGAGLGPARSFNRCVFLAFQCASMLKRCYARCLAVCLLTVCIQQFAI